VFEKMRLIDADALKTKKVYSEERHEKVVPVVEIDWMPTVDAIPREWWEQLRTSIEDLRDNNEYDTDSDMFQTMKFLANLMKVIEGKHEVD
jgi:hypothetical protein